MSNRIGTAVTNAATIMPEWITGINFFKARHASDDMLASASQSVAIMRMPGGSRIVDITLQSRVEDVSAATEFVLARVWDSLNGETRPYLSTATAIGDGNAAAGFQAQTIRANRVENLGQRITGSANLIVGYSSPTGFTASSSLTVDLAVWYTRDIERSST